MRLLTKLNDGLAKIEGFFLCLFLAGMIVLAFLQVIMRNVFNAGIPWADTVVRLLVLWVGFLGAVLATKLEQHLTIEVLTKYMPERARHFSAVAVKVFAGVVCFFLFSASLRFLANERLAGESFYHLFPAWWTLTIIPVTFLLIPFHLLFGIGRNLRYLIKGKVEPL